MFAQDTPFIYHLLVLGEYWCVPQLPRFSLYECLFGTLLGMIHEHEMLCTYTSFSVWIPMATMFVYTALPSHLLYSLAWD